MDINEFVRLCRLVFCAGGFDEASDAWQTLKAFVLAQQAANTGSPKLPTLEECYQAIPFPSDASECAMFVAGIAECHKFICRQLRAGA